ncbi:MAG: PfkB family carbohydrate kinase [Promethearchaeia archaeon]
MKQNRDKVLILGSLAFDYIMGFEENFTNAVSVDFHKGDYQSTITANSRLKHFGGTAGNIAYNLGLLKVGHVTVLGAVGEDFNTLGYKKHIEKFDNISLNVDIHEDDFTAACYIVNDVKKNQMIIFHGGALERCKDIDLRSKIKNPKEYLYAINSTQGVDAMTNFANQLSELEIPMIFDPGQVTPLFREEILKDIIEKSEIIIGNNYEIEQILKKTHYDLDALVERVRAVITTKGKEGSELIYRDEQNKRYDIMIPICKPKDIKDTTGAGDGYRAGILSGLILNMTLLDACRLGSIIGSFVVETDGAQTQQFQISDIRKRFFDTYEYLPSELEIL